MSCGRGIEEKNELLWEKGKALGDGIDTLARSLGRIEDAHTTKLSENTPETRAMFEVLRWKDEMTDFRRTLTWCLDVKNFPNWAYWRSQKNLLSAPVRCAETIQKAFDLSQPEKIFFVSATLSIEGDFTFWNTETGIVPDRTVIVDSPFDHYSQVQGVVVDIPAEVGSGDYDLLIARVVE